MAKQIKVGSVIKAKEKGKPDYIQISAYQVGELKKVLATLGDKDTLYINLESKASQLASLDAAEESGKLSADYVEKQRGFVEKIPDFVRFELITILKN